MKKRNNKGFTLVELLAVIVVLIVVLLISLIAVKKTKDKAQIDAMKANAMAYLDAVRSQSEIAEATSIFYSGIASYQVLTGAGVSVTGKKPDDGFMLFHKYEVKYLCLQYGNYKVVKADGEAEVIKGKCNINSFDPSSYVNVTRFSYTGSEATFTATQSGMYRLEAWGAQGGNYDDTFFGGYGAYSFGQIYLNQGDTIYVNVGGAGNSSPANGANNGGYNGGGKSYVITSSCSNFCGSGGGATSFSTSTGLVKDLSSSDLLLVAGGGGGATYRYCSATDYAQFNGGSGGGIVGGSFTYTETRFGYTAPLGGSQTAGGAGGTSNNESGLAAGSYGLGGATTRTGGYTCGTGGGGGYYGGGNGMFIGAGGGSSYIANPELTSKGTICYSCEEDGSRNTMTISTTCSSKDAYAGCAKKENGFAQITYMGSENNTNVDYDD